MLSAYLSDLTSEHRLETNQLNVVPDNAKIVLLNSSLRRKQRSNSKAASVYNYYYNNHINNPLSSPTLSKKLSRWETGSPAPNVYNNNNNSSSNHTSNSYYEVS